jgi:cell division septal protein FtsQ
MMWAVRRWRAPRQDNRRVKRPVRSRRRRYKELALFVLLPIGLGVGLPSLTRYVEVHPYFTVQEIAVDENGGFSQADLLEWGGVKVGMSMWAVDPEQVERRLLSHSWIQSAQVRRDFPQRLRLAVSAHRPVAIVLHNGLRYLDESGSCFTRPERSPALDLPYVSGFAGLSLDAPNVRAALDGVLRLLSLARIWREPLSEISWDARQGYSLFLEERRVTIRLGWETAPEKFTQIGKVLATWTADAPAAVFDARFADQIVVRPYVVESGAQSRTLSRPL